jgi:hypothetical protein
VQAFSDGCDHGVTIKVAAGGYGANHGEGFRRRRSVGFPPDVFRVCRRIRRCWPRRLQDLHPRLHPRRGRPLARPVRRDDRVSPIRKIARKTRRAGSGGSAFGTGSLRRPARLLIEDPMPKNSTHSYFLQHADLAAYAAFRVYDLPATRAVQGRGPPPTLSRMDDVDVPTRYSLCGRPHRPLPGRLLRGPRDCRLLRNRPVALPRRSRERVAPARALGDRRGHGSTGWPRRLVTELYRAPCGLRGSACPTR